MALTITILGCGSSGGVPRVGNDWGACDPANPKNRRRRCSILIEQKGPEGTTRVLVDTGPDLREQLISAHVTALDAVLLTHAHADHIHGVDDLRPLVLSHAKRIPMYMDDVTGALMHKRFGYIFQTPEGSQYPPLVTAHGLTPGVAVDLQGAGGPLRVTPIHVHHGDIEALGFRIHTADGDVAYTPDVNGIPDASLPLLEGLKLWIIDTLRVTHHPSHFSLAEGLGWIEKMEPARAVLTNLHTSLDYATLKAQVPGIVDVAFDGMKLEIQP